MKRLPEINAGCAPHPETRFKKYQADHANIMVSSISFYILLTFIPFTLFSLFIISYVIDISHPAAHMEKYIASIIPAPYNAVIVKKLLRELNLISLSKRLSGPLGLLFLLLFTSRLFAVMRPAFQLIFGTTKKGFIKGKQEEFVLTIVFCIHPDAYLLQLRVFTDHSGETGKNPRRFYDQGLIFYHGPCSRRRDVLVPVLFSHTGQGQEEALPGGFPRCGLSGMPANISFSILFCT